LKKDIILGLDIGGSGIKGALVNVKTGKLESDRIRFATPSPAFPDLVAETVQLLVNEIGYQGSIIGCGFPAVVSKGVAKSAANIHESWINTNVESLLSKATGKQVFVLNDADAAGVAEMNFGSMQENQGISILLTLGTGIGSALFVDDKLVPNTELGHIYLKDSKKIIEKMASNHIRKKENLSYKEWANRLNKLLRHLEHIFSPEIVVLGGGISKKFEEYCDYFDDFDFEIAPARLLNQAGLTGAALYAIQQSSKCKLI